MLEKSNLLGAVTAIAFFVSAILVFTFRLLGKPQYGHWIGYFEFLLAIPLIYLLRQAPQLGRPALYYIQIACMLAWLVVEALLDYILKVDFRNARWMVISYVVLFFAGTGGLLGATLFVGFLSTAGTALMTATPFSVSPIVHKTGIGLYFFGVVVLQTMIFLKEWSLKSIPRGLPLLSLSMVLVYFVFVTLVVLFEQGVLSRTTPIIWEWLAFATSIAWVLAQSIVLGKTEQEEAH